MRALELISEGRDNEGDWNDMPNRPKKQLLLTQGEQFTMLSSWCSYVFLGRYRSGDLAVWSYIEDEMGRQNRGYIGQVRTVDQLFRALEECCAMVDLDGSPNILRDRQLELRQLAPELAVDVEAQLKDL